MLMKLKSFAGWFWRHKKISLFLILIIAGLIYWFGFKNGNQEELEESTVSRGEVVEEMILSGLVIADEHAKLSFPASGRISWVGVKEGEEVYKGKPLAKLDTTALNSAYQQALSNLRAAEANLAQVHDEVKGNDSDETFEEKNTRVAAETAKDKAYESVVVAQDNLRNSTLVAPFNGMVTSVVNPFSGVTVVAGTPQIEIINPESIHFEIAADQTEVIDIQKDEKVRIVLDSLENKELEGVVSYVSYSLSENALSAVYEVKINFVNLTNTDFTYRIGMTGDVHFTLNKKDNVLYVPSTFIKSDDKGTYVLTEKGKTKKYIEVGLEGEERTEISGDISEGTLIYD